MPITEIIITEGITTATDAAKAPQSPPVLAPTKVAVFKAITPGVDSAMATRSSISLLVIQPLFFADFFLDECYHCVAAAEG